jgi:hypothetical protein
MAHFHTTKPANAWTGEYAGSIDDYAWKSEKDARENLSMLRATSGGNIWNPCTVVRCGRDSVWIQEDAIRYPVCAK